MRNSSVFITLYFTSHDGLWTAVGCIYRLMLIWHCCFWDGFASQGTWSVWRWFSIEV